MAAASPIRPRRDQVRNRKALVEAAKEVFAQRGVDAPMDVVAKHAGLSNASLYRHFSGRTDILVEVLLANLRRAEKVLAEALQRPSGWVGFVLYLDWLFAEQIRNPAYLSALRAVPAGHSDEVDQLRNKLLAELEVLITRSKAEGSFRADRWLEDVFLYLALNEQLPQAHSDPTTASRRLLELALSGLQNTHTNTAEWPATEPPEVLALRRTIGHEVAGLPHPGPAPTTTDG